MENLIEKLKLIISQEKTKSLSRLSTNILYVTILGSKKEQDIYENVPIITELGNLASNLEIKNGDDKQMKKDWKRIKEIVNALDKGEYIKPNDEMIASKFEEQ